VKNVVNMKNDGLKKYKEKIKMAKIIVIEKCIECPYIEYFRKEDNYFCKWALKKLNKKKKEIPKWCPLKNEYVPAWKDDTMRRRNIGDPR